MSTEASKMEDTPTPELRFFVKQLDMQLERLSEKMDLCIHEVSSLKQNSGNAGVRQQDTNVPPTSIMSPDLRVSLPSPRSERRKAGVKKRRWNVNAIPPMEEEEYEALADERSRLRAARTASTDDADIKEAPKLETWTSRLATWVKSKNFEGIFAAVIFSNALFLGISLEYESGHIGLDTPPIFKAISEMY